MPGGRSNANYRVDLVDGQAALLVRLYIRDPRQAQKEQVLARYLADRGLPVPRLLHSAPANPATGHPYAVFEWIEGEPLDRIAQNLSGDALATLGSSIGRTLGDIHEAKAFDFYGFLDDHCNVTEKADVGGFGLVAHLQRCLLVGRGQERLGPELTRAVLDLAFMEGDLLDLWECKPCLVHGDFSASNILVQHSARGWRISGVIDWEFAFSGKPFFDLGQVLRTWPGERAELEDGLEQGYCRRGRRLPRHWKRTSKIADLFAWAEYLARPNLAPSIISAARSAIAEIVWGRGY